MAIACGSRGIASLVPLLTELVETLKKQGATVFVVPAMGSHGGASAGGQRKLLEGIGLGEDRIGCPIHSSMEVVELGVTDEGYPVQLDRAASTADGLVIFNRIKVHTIFSGEIESGFLKMLAVGLGNDRGAVDVHYYGEQHGYPGVIRAVAGRILEVAPLCIGIGILENASHEVAEIAVVPARDFVNVEPGLLKRSKEIMARLPLRRIDLLVVDRIGKDISGTGMDIRLLGRIPGIPPRESPPEIRRIVVRDITGASEGNANGIGLADVVTERTVAKVDWDVTYRNCLTSFSPDKGKRPLTASSDREAIVWALKTLPFRTPGRLRILHVRDTSDLTVTEVSAVAAEDVDTSLYRVDRKKPFNWSFDDLGNLVSDLERR